MNIDNAKEIIEKHGLEFVGYWPFPGDPLRDLVCFNDETGSTLAIPFVTFSEEALIEKMKKRKEAA